METRISKVCVPLEELESLVHIKTAASNDNLDSLKSYWRRSNDRSAVVHFHCPVAGCVYDAASERYFTRLKYLKQHFIKVHATKSFVCEKCKKGFAKLSTLTAHHSTCGITFKCTCGVYYTTREALLTHAKRKQHVLPNESKVIIRGQARTLNCAKDGTVGKLCGVKNAIQPTTLLVLLNNTQRDSFEPKATITPKNTVSSVKKPCFILPKPAPLHDLPLQTVAAMALSELADSEFVKQKVAVGIQTEENGKSKEKRVCCGCKHNEVRREGGSHHSKAVRRVNKRSMETQTAKSTVIRKRTKWAFNDQGTQTDLFISRQHNLLSLTTSATQTIPQMMNGDVEQSLNPAVMSNLYGTSNPPYLLDGSRDWYFTDSVMSPLPFPSDQLTTNRKICQTIKELDVDVNFNLSAQVSSSTQTSPRVSMFSRGLSCPAHLLDGNLQGYLDMDTLPILQDYSMLSCSSNSYLPQDSESSMLKHCNLHGNVEHLSSETQTDCNFSSLLLPDSGDCDSGEDDVGILSSNIQTQTSEDLESIPYDQLWSHMETQTSDAFLFSDLGGLCDIQTQTGYESCNPSVVDMHTQTCVQPTAGLTAQQINMETQTFLSLLESGISPFTDSHTQTSNIMGMLEYCCAASELDGC